MHYNDLGQLMQGTTVIHTPGYLESISDKECIYDEDEDEGMQSESEEESSDEESNDDLEDLKYSSGEEENVTTTGK